MAKKPLKVSRVDLDNDLEIPEFDFDMSPPKDDRKPIKKIFSGVVSGAKAGIKSSGFLKNMLEKAMPTGYEEIVKVVDSASTEGRKLYDKAAKEIKPSLNDLAKATKNLVPAENKKLKGVLDNIDKWSSNNERSFSNNDKNKIREDNLALQLGDTFKFQMEQGARARSEDNVRYQLTQGLDSNRHRDNVQLLGGINNSLSRLASYQEKITSAYQKKSLEIQYRSYFVHLDNLEEAKNNNNLVKQQLEAVVKNTALPDSVKLTQSDYLKNTLRNKFYDNLTGGLFKGSNEFIAKFSKNLGDKITANVTDMASQFMSMGSSMADAMSMGKEMGAGDSTTQGAETAGGFAVNMLGEKFLKSKGGLKLKEAFDKHPHLGKNVKKGIYAARNLPQMADDFKSGKKGERDEEKWYDSVSNVLVRTLKDLIPSMNVEKDLQKDTLQNINSPYHFTRHTHKTINEIIPGYLARILREIEVTRTGNEKTQLTVYDLKSNKFSGMKAAVANIKASLVHSTTKATTDSQLKEYFDEIEKQTGKKLSPAAKEALGKKLIRDRFDGKSDSSERLTNENTYSEKYTKKHAKEIVEYYKSLYVGINKATSAGMDNVNSLNKNYLNLGTGMIDSRGPIQDLVNAGQIDLLREAGLIEEGSEDIIKYDKNDKKKEHAQRVTKDTFNINMDTLLDMNHGERSSRDDDGVRGSKGRNRSKLTQAQREHNRNMRGDNSSGDVTGTSDINAKQDFKAVPKDFALNAVRQTPITSWNYKPGQGDNKPHIGGMAQTMNKTMGSSVAPGGKKIDLINLSGVTMKAIQELDKQQAVLMTVLNNNFTSMRGSFDNFISKAKDKFSNKTDTKENLSGNEKPTSVINSIHDILGKSLEISAGILAQLAKLTDVVEANGSGTGGSTNNTPNNTKGIFGHIKNILSSGTALGGKVIGLGANVGKRLTQLTLNSYKPAIAIAKVGMKIGKSVLQGSLVRGNRDLSESSKYGDIYVGSETEPRMTAIRMINGCYTKKVDDKDVIVKTIKDIDSTIYDNGLVVLQANEISKAYTKSIKSGLIGSTLLATTKSLINISKGISSLSLAAIPQTFRAIKSVANTIATVLDPVKDIYVKGNTEPVLLARIMNAGGYYSKHTGKPITRPREIDGAVVNSEGQVVLSEEEFKQGIFDSHGNSIKSLFSKVLGAAVGTVKVGFDIARSLGRNFTNLLLGSLKLPKFGMKGLGSLFGYMGGKEHLDVLKQIRDVLDERLPTTRKNRKGSWREMNKSKREGESTLGEKISQTADKLKSATPLSVVSGLFGKLFGKKEKVAEDSLDELKDIKHLLAVQAVEGAVPGVGGGKLGKLGKLAKVGGKMLGAAGAAYGAYSAYEAAKAGNYGEAALDAGMATASGIATVGGLGGLATAGTAIATGAGALATGALGVATGIGALISAPVVLGGLAVAAVGIGGYYAYKYLSKNRNPNFSMYRYIQYGFSKDDDQYADKVFEFEDMLFKNNVVYESHIAKLTEKNFDYKKVFSLFGIDPKNKDQVNTWGTWFQNRFKPIYLTWLTSLLTVDNKAKLGDIESFKTADKTKLLPLIEFSDGPYNVTASPFIDLKTLPSIAKDVAFYYSTVKTEIDKLIDEAKNPKKVSPATSFLNAGKNGVANLNGDYTQKTSDILKLADITGIGYRPADSMATQVDAENMTGNNASSGVDSKQIGFLKPNVAGGKLFTGERGDDFMKLQPGVNIKDINPEMLKNLRGMAEEYGTLTGKRIQINDGFRSREYQAALYKKDPSKAAPPGSSLHEFGLAVDINSGDVDTLDKLGLMKKYGFTRPVGAEPWHVEPSGIQTALSQAKNDTNLASKLVVASLGRGGGGYGSISSATKYSRNLDYAKQIFESGGQILDNDITDTVAKNIPAGPTASDYKGNAGRGTMGIASASIINKTDTTGKIDSESGKVDEFKSTSAGSSNASNDVPKPTGKGFQAVKPTLDAAAATVGVHPNLMYTFAGMESSFNPNAKASTSSASGLFQFTNDTWKDMVDKHGDKYGITPGTSPFDGSANALMGAEFLKQNQKDLSAVKANPNSTDLYTAHFLGNSGAKKLLGSNPNTNAASLMPNAASANKSIFYNNGEANTVGEVYATLDGKVKETERSLGIISGPISLNSAMGPSNTGYQKASFAPQAKLNTNTNTTGGTPPPQVKQNTAIIANNTPNTVTQFNSNNSSQPVQNNKAEMNNALNSVGDTLKASLEIQKQMLDTLKMIVKVSGPEKFTEAINSMKQNVSDPVTNTTPTPQARPSARVPVSMARTMV